MLAIGDNVPTAPAAAVGAERSRKKRHSAGDCESSRRHGSSSSAGEKKQSVSGDNDDTDESDDEQNTSVQGPPPSIYRLTRYSPSNLLPYCWVEEQTSLRFAVGCSTTSRTTSCTTTSCTTTSCTTQMLFVCCMPSIFYSTCTRCTTCCEFAVQHVVQQVEARGVWGGALKMQDWKMTDERARLENAGLEIDGRKWRAGKCRTGK